MRVLLVAWVVACCGCVTTTSVSQRTLFTTTPNVPQGFAGEVWQKSPVIDPQTRQGMVRIAVASLPLEYGAEITPDKVKFVNYPQTSLPPGTYRSVAELLPQGKRRVALRPIQVNQPLLAADRGELPGVLDPQLCGHLSLP